MAKRTTSPEVKIALVAVSLATTLGAWAVLAHTDGGVPQVAPEVGATVARARGEEHLPPVPTVVPPTTLFRGQASGLRPLPRVRTRSSR